MAKAAVGESFVPNLSFGRAHAEAMPKRKTPSELRGEQLKRRSFEIPTEAQLASLLAPDQPTNEAPGSAKKVVTSRNPKYIDTKLNEHFPVKKSSTICRGIYGLQKAKDSLKSGKTPGFSFSDQLRKPSSASTFAEKNIETSEKNGKSEIPESSDPCPKSSCNPGFQKIEKCSQSTFRSVAQLSIGREASFDSAGIDMDKALKGFTARELPGSTSDSPEMLGTHHTIANKSIQREYQICGNKTPLDLTLKTTLHLVSSSSVKWLHRIISSGIGNTAGELHCPLNGSEQHRQSEVRPNTTSDLLVSKALVSWKYPQSSLPPSVISAMSLSASAAELQFLKKRHQDWEDSFHNLYYLLRKKNCCAFYVYTTQFVALFVGDLSTSKKNCCNAYISRSTNGLRAVLAENDISFTMPLCRSKVEQATADDLVELSEIEKHNLGQAHHLDLSSDVDNSPQSLLAFLGNRNVHALFDFLLNYRSFLSSLSSFDVPVLYSPVTFKNSSVSSPEVRCKEMKRADLIPSSSGSDTDDTGSYPNPPAISVCHSVEVKDDILPPWVVSGICAAMASRSSEFEASFTLEPKSAGLNIALDSLCLRDEVQKVAPSEGVNVVGFAEAVAVPWLRSVTLKSLKHSVGSYTATVTPL